MMKQKSRKRKRGQRREKPEFEQKLLDLARVTRVVKGGRRFRFRATVVIGNRKGKVGVGVSKGTDVSQAIQKAFSDAKKKMITVNLDNGTIAHDIEKKLGSARILLKAAPEGRGIIAGGAVRTVVDLLGIKNIVSKSFGTSNKLNVARATVAALQDIAEPKNTTVEASEEPKKEAKKEVKKVAKKAVKKEVQKEVKKVAKKAVKKTVETEDLTKIEGVGPKIAELLAGNGMATYADLATAKKADLTKLLDENKLAAHDPSTWAKQAKLARDAKWDELKVLQDELMGGKKVAK